MASCHACGRLHTSLDEASYCCPHRGTYEYPVKTEATPQGIAWSIYMEGEWHECPVSKRQPTYEEIVAAFRYLEERLLPVRTQTLSQFV